MSAPMEKETFVRELEKNDGKTIEIHQLEIGDVGCVVWDAAIVLSKFFETDYFLQGSVLQGKSVIELGAGTGVVGIMLATLGADILITDLPDFIPLINKNITANSGLINGKASAEELTWGKDVIANNQFDYIVLADCIYYDQSLEPLVCTIRNLCNKNTVVFCCFEERTTGNKPELQKKFFELIEETFDVEEIPQEQQDPLFRSDDIHIMKFTLKYS